MQKQGENEVYKTKKDMLTTIHAIQNKEKTDPICLAVLSSL